MRASSSSRAMARARTSCSLRLLNDRMIELVGFGGTRFDDQIVIQSGLASPQKRGLESASEPQGQGANNASRKWSRDAGVWVDRIGSGRYERGCRRGGRAFEAAGSQYKVCRGGA